jgi:hypothetical protein
VDGDADISDDDPIRPLGRPIGACLVVPAGRLFDPVRSAVSAIDAVHGDGSLPEIVVRITRSVVEAASYEWDDRTGRPLSLNVSRRAPRPHLAVVHEVGHILDHLALGGERGFGSEMGRLPTLMQSIGGTAAARRLHELRGMRQVLIHIQPHRRERFTLDQAFINYLLEPRELFARAYAQYVTVRSGDLRLLTQLQEAQHDLFVGIVYHQQWDADDFQPVLGAFDRMLRGRRWIG